MNKDHSLVRKQLAGYRLATAEILYHLPDHPGLLQAYVWQDYDIAPKYPVLSRFLDFWIREIEGPIHSVRLAGKRLIGAAELASVSEYGLN
ncbi:usg protein [Hyphococcus luteus]|uniref:Usg family protein n=1 Tax=Hyphococcus luteus TaxID=2058213 RepID=A0A2S7KAT9_9PROT|nr:usg protein [Marinicaulis flavus]PQA89625.1 Usg family protein [Marinicaulis flavus]